VVLALFIVLKLSVFKRIFSFVHILLFIDMFYESTKSKKPRKNKKTAEKNYGYLRKSSSITVLQWSSAAPFNMMAYDLIKLIVCFFNNDYGYGPEFVLVSFVYFYYFQDHTFYEILFATTYPEYKLEKQ
jgi:hypothetical protein